MSFLGLGEIERELTRAISRVSVSAHRYLVSYDADPVLYRSAGIKGGQNRLVVCGCTCNAPIDSILFAPQDVATLLSDI